jgi:hypothetical protein
VSIGSWLRRRTLPVAIVLAVVAAGGTSCGVPMPVTLGITADEVGAVDTVGSALNAPVGFYQWYQAWGARPVFDAARADAALGRGASPLLTWEPWVAGAGVEQPEFALATISRGDHDGYVRSFARQVRDWGRPLALRFLHELNAPFYPWGAGVNGNTAEAAVAAWRHVHAIFAAEGAANVSWFWSVNIHVPGYAPVAGLYPGDDVVSWVSIDGYNAGTALPWGGWRSPEELFGPTLAAVRDVTDRPLALTEVGCAEAGGDKAGWITDLFALAQEERIPLIIWFEFDKEADWRLTSSPAAARAAGDALRATRG